MGLPCAVQSQVDEAKLRPVRFVAQPTPWPGTPALALPHIGLTRGRGILNGLSRFR